MDERHGPNVGDAGSSPAGSTNFMSMQIISCDECGQSSIPLDSVSVDVNLNKSHFCDKCYRSHTEKTHYFFCSLACFLEYCWKVTREEKTFEFDRYHREENLRRMQAQMQAQNPPQTEPEEGWGSGPNGPCAHS